MSKDLHLNDEQLIELKGMGPLAEEAAYSLQLWCDADTWPWEIDSTDKGYVNGERSGDSGPYLLLHPGDMAQFDNENARAIVYARNTAELRAALVYWWMKMGLAHNTRSPAIANARKAKVTEIQQALKELRNE